MQKEGPMTIRRAGMAVGLASLALIGCGGDDKSGKANGTAPKPSPAPRYRVGQFCFPKKQKQYQDAGFTCTKKHHLAKH